MSIDVKRRLNPEIKFTEGWGHVRYVNTGSWHLDGKNDEKNGQTLKEIRERIPIKDVPSLVPRWKSYAPKQKVNFVPKKNKNPFPDRTWNAPNTESVKFPPGTIVFVETVKKPKKNDVNASNKEDLTGLGGAPSSFLKGPECPQIGEFGLQEFPTRIQESPARALKGLQESWKSLRETRQGLAGLEGILAGILGILARTLPGFADKNLQEYLVNSCKAKACQISQKLSFWADSQGFSKSRARFPQGFLKSLQGFSQVLQDPAGSPARMSMTPASLAGPLHEIPGFLLGILQSKLADL